MQVVPRRPSSAATMRLSSRRAVGGSPQNLHVLDKPGELGQLLRDLRLVTNVLLPLLTSTRPPSTKF